MKTKMNHFVIFISALLLAAVGHMATDIYLPSFPAMVEYFNVSNSQVQLTLGAYMLSFCLVPLFAGPISDRIGRKQPIFFGIGLGICATLLCALSNNIDTLIFSRFLQGIGLGIVVTVSRAILPDNFRGKELAKYFSYNTIILPILLSIAPPVGGVIQEYSSWRMIFVFILIYLVLLIFLMKVVISKGAFQNSLAKTQQENYLTSFKSLLKNRQFMSYTVYSVLIFMGVTCYLTLGPFIFQEMAGLSPSQFGSTSTVCGIAAASSGLINSRLINLYSARRLLSFTLPFIFISGVLLIAFSYYNLREARILLLPIFIFFSMISTSFANSTALGLETVKGNFGAAMALLSSLQFLGGGLASVIVSFAAGAPMKTLGLVFVLIAVCCLIINVLSSKRPLADYSFPG